MKVQLHINGSYEIELHPENDVERAVMKEMAARAERGQPVKLYPRGATAADITSFTVGVENS